MLKKLFCMFVGVGCKWKIISNTDYELSRECDNYKSKNVITIYTMQCETCGEIKFKNSPGSDDL